MNPDQQLDHQAPPCSSSTPDNWKLLLAASAFALICTAAVILGLSRGALWVEQVVRVVQVVGQPAESADASEDMRWMRKRGNGAVNEGVWG